MTTLKLPEDMPIENKIISRSIESAQKRVEGNNFDLRKHLVEYDDVINKHRESIYRRRRQILQLSETSTESSAEDASLLTPLSPLILEMIDNEIEQVVSFHTQSDNVDDWNISEIAQVMSTIIDLEVNKLTQELVNLGGNSTVRIDKIAYRDSLVKYLSEMVHKAYDELLALAKDIGLDWLAIEKSVLLRSIDSRWMDHLDAMDYMRQGIGLRGYGQRDPLVEYKKEAYRLFNELNAAIQKQVVYAIFKIVDLSRSNEQKIKQMINISAPAKKIILNASGEMSTTPVERKMRDSTGHKIGRNDPCPCGSGKKYKKCCGR